MLDPSPFKALNKPPDQVVFLVSHYLNSCTMQTPFRIFPSLNPSVVLCFGLIFTPNFLSILSLYSLKLPISSTSLSSCLSIFCPKDGLDTSFCSNHHKPSNVYLKPFFAGISLTHFYPRHLHPLYFTLAPSFTLAC